MATIVQVRQKRSNAVRRPIVGASPVPVQTQRQPELTTETAIEQAQSLEIVQTLMLTSVRRHAVDLITFTH